VERWCNQVAAELLVRLTGCKQEYNKAAHLLEEVSRLARRFKVSHPRPSCDAFTDAGGLTEEQFWKAYAAEVETVARDSRGTGGNFYLTQAAAREQTLCDSTGHQHP